MLVANSTLNQLFDGTLMPNYNTNRKLLIMPTYKDWELYEVLPAGWKIDKHCGSPLFGYDFCTDGKSVLNGGKRALVKTETRKAIMKEFHSDNLHLFNCDNMELMKTFKDKEFDLAIVDKINMLLLLICQSIFVFLYQIKTI